MIKITHNREEGTLIEGSRKGDGVWDIVKNHGFRFSRNVGLYIPRSRDNHANRWTIDQAAEALRAAGHTVDVEIDDATPGRPFAEAENDRNEWAQERADRYAARASRNTAAGEARWERTRERMSHLPPGQPILVGHHSERGHRRLLDWAHTQDGKAVEELNKGKHWAGRAQTAANYQRHRENPGTTRRRIDGLEAKRRGIVRALEEGRRFETSPCKEEGPPAGATLVRDYGDGYAAYRVEHSDAYTARAVEDIAQIDDEIGYWRQVLAQAEERGVKLWSKDDFTKGDFVIYHEVAVEVMRVNAKSLTIPWSHYWITSGPLSTVEQCQRMHRSGGRMHTDTLAYDKVQGRITAAELEGLTVGEAKALIASKIREARGLG